MQNLVQHILALTNGDPADLKQLYNLLQKHNDDVLGKAGSADLDEALVQLDPGLHTLGWIYLLYVPPCIRLELKLSKLHQTVRTCVDEFSGWIL
jgi:hypothetical protein